MRIPQHLISNKYIKHIPELLQLQNDPRFEVVIILHATIVWNITIEDVVYKMKLQISRNSISLPKVYLLNHKNLHKIQFHIKKGLICLNMDLILFEWWREYDYKLYSFMEYPVKKYIESLHHYCKFGEWPFGEWKHKEEGKLEFIDQRKDLNSIKDHNEAIKNEQLSYVQHFHP